MAHTKKTETTETRFSNGKWHLSNLQFLLTFMEHTGQTTKTIADRLNCTQQSVVHMLNKDDALLDRITEIFEAFNCNITFRLERDEDRDSDITIDPSIYKSVTSRYETKKLAFIRTAMNRYGYTIADLRDALEKKGYPMVKSTIENWFAKDSIYISHLFRIASAMDAKLKIDITLKQN